MYHLFSISAYGFDADGYGGVGEAVRKIKNAGADGAELLTGYFDPDPEFGGFAKGVHLPYATDWYSVWTGDTEYADIVSDADIKHRSYGRNEKEIVGTLYESIVHASSLRPAYGVFHASNVRMSEVMGFEYTDSDTDILNAVAELLNRTVQRFPRGEPPFKIVLENLWWPGLSLEDGSGFEILLEGLNFDNWGLCLDTGHLMNRLGTCRNEEKSIADILRIVNAYPKAMKDRVDVMHLHMSLSADYREECIRDPVPFMMTTDSEMIAKAYEHVCRIDHHRPFTCPDCRKIADVLEPEYVTHEIFAPSPSEKLSGFAGQRSMFPPSGRE